VISGVRYQRLLRRDKTPYIVPLSFGYDGASIYFHTAPEGMKSDFIASNDRVCFELEHEVRLIPNDSNPCQWSFSFFSVIGFGRVEEVTDPQRRVYLPLDVGNLDSGVRWTYDCRIDPVRGSIAGELIPPTPAGIVADIQGYIASGAIAPGFAKSLESMLRAVDQALQRGSANAGVNILNAFLNEVKAQRGTGLPETVANDLVFHANYILGHLLPQ